MCKQLDIEGSRGITTDLNRLPSVRVVQKWVRKSPFLYVQV